MSDQIMKSTESSLASELQRKFLNLDNPSTDVIRATRQISQAFTVRGNALLADGYYHLAVSDYGVALNHRLHKTPEDDYNPEATENRLKALDYLGWFFRSRPNPGQPDPNMSALERDAVCKAKIPHGYLIVADDESILTFCPLSDEGREEALAFADELAIDAHLRFKIDNLYLTETDEFEITVYRYDGTNLEEVHRAPARDEYGTLVRE